MEKFLLKRLKVNKIKKFFSSKPVKYRDTINAIKKNIALIIEKLERSKVKNTFLSRMQLKTKKARFVPRKIGKNLIFPFFVQN